MGAVSAFSDKPIVTHTHKFLVTTEIMNGDIKVGEIRMRCESCVCEMIFPTNPRAYYGEQIAREIMERKENKKLSCAPSSIQLCECDIGRAFDEAAAIARGTNECD